MLAEKIKEHKELTADVFALQTEYANKPMPAEVGKEFEEKAKKAEALQVEIEDIENREKRVKKLGDWSREVPSVPLPGGIKERPSDNGKPAAYVSAGQAFVESKAYKDYLDNGKPLTAGSRPLALNGLHGTDRYVPFDQKALDELYESKAVPTIGTSPAVIMPDRIAEVVRETELDRLVLRDIVQVLPTGSNSVEYLRVAGTQPEYAAPVAELSAKPEATMELEVVSAPVRTLAVWMPVTEQQLEDIPQIRALIDSELLFDIKRLEEYQMIWGNGLGQNLLGIMNTPGVTEMTRTPDVGAGTTVTVIDEIRAAMTDIRVANLEPNGIVIHPIDWETVVLNKGTDDHYLAQAFPGGDGSLRIWGLRVVETVAATAYRAADATDQRVIIVGDFTRGATLWDRHQASVAVGYINDDFTKNKRTIRAEERVAFGVKRPAAFKYIETVAAA